jgi:hypothetical protein
MFKKNDFSGFFGDYDDMGFFRCHLYTPCILGNHYLHDITFKLDSASSFTVVFDDDFLSICRSLGQAMKKHSAILSWIRIRPDLFTADTIGFTPAGELFLYKIKNANLLLLEKGRFFDPFIKDPINIYGAFSSKFIAGERASTSLLGIDAINRFKIMKWCHSSLSIKLSVPSTRIYYKI